MYLYYLLMAMKWKPKWFHPMTITVAQISQMIAGVLVTAAGWYIMLSDEETKGSNGAGTAAAEERTLRDRAEPSENAGAGGDGDRPANSNEEGGDMCWLTRENNLAATIMYGSYLVLFVEFFLQRYFGQSATNKKKTAKSESGARTPGTRRQPRRQRRKED